MSVKDVPRDQRVKTALWLSDMQEVVNAMTAVAALPQGVDGEFTVWRDDGEELATVWWDAESETWLCNWERGSGA